MHRTETARWEHALVVGGGFAGLLAARVLADHFRRVTILEQDQVTAETDHRPGIPQARHPHVLMARGAAVVEELFPGLREELAGLGAPIFDLGVSSMIKLPVGWTPRVAIGIVCQSVSRATLEKTIRRRILAHPAVTLRAGVRVRALFREMGGGPVTAVRVARSRDTTAETGQDETVDADLIVIATGRTSTLTRWLNDVGLPSPREHVVDAQGAYTTRLHRSRPDTNPDPSQYTAGIVANIELTSAPHVRRSGGVFLIEHGLHLASLYGVMGDSAPPHEVEFLDYARSLRNPHIAQAIRTGAPIGSIYRFTALANHWSLYHRLPQWPDRLLAMGDAVCTLNPIYGQGMTVAATQALTLRTLLAQRRNGDLPGIAGTFQRRIAADLRWPWLMASSYDRGWTPDKGSLTACLARWYLGRLLSVIPHDINVFRRFVAVSQMLDNPVVLLHPRVLAGLALAALRHPPGPEVLHDASATHNPTGERP